MRRSVPSHHRGRLSVTTARIRCDHIRNHGRSGRSGCINQARRRRPFRVTSISVCIDRVGTAGEQRPTRTRGQRSHGRAWTNDLGDRVPVSSRGRRPRRTRNADRDVAGRRPTESSMRVRSPTSTSRTTATAPLSRSKPQTQCVVAGFTPDRCRSASRCSSRECCRVGTRTDDSASVGVLIAWPIRRAGDRSAGSRRCRAQALSSNSRSR